MTAAVRRVICIGLDGLDPGIAEPLMAAGELPNLARLRDAGSYRRLATTTPAQTPVAWSSFATGVNPGSHGIFDFLRRDAADYRPELSLFDYERPNRFLPPRPVNRRGGTALWETLTGAGVPSVVLRHPCTYPPSKPLRGRMLAGVGVPDIRGGFGTATVYTSGDPSPRGEGEVVIPIGAGGGAVETYLRGPPGRDGDLRVGLTLRFENGGSGGAAGGEGGASGSGGGRSVRIESDGKPGVVVVDEGEWSDWLRVKFRAGPLQTVRGRVRFHLVSAREPYLLYASPVNLDPEVPQHPISEPWDYAWELDRTLGGFHTLGMPEDHNGVNNGRISEDTFLAQCDHVRRERLAMMHHELARHDDGFFFCLFDTPDRVQHIFWRYREPDHPANRVHDLDPALRHAIDDEYRACDRAVGEALEYADDGTLFLVASDHGFTSFQRQIHLNRWLQEHGFLVLKDGAEPDGDGDGDADRAGLGGVDWSRTRAYALGLVGIYLNLQGREGQGIVAPEDAGEVAETIRSGLAGLVDEYRGGAPAVHGVHHRHEVYHGPFTHDAPDLVVRCAPGYRVSSATALGGVPGSVIADNRRRWSGDHVVDPGAVPGILFSNRGLHGDDPGIMDLAPTILSALGVPVPEAHEGESLLR